MKFTLSFVFVLLSFTIFSQNARPFSIYFDYDYHQIRESEHKTFSNLLDSLKTHAEFILKISGNTDADGSNAYNQTLSEKRIAAVKNYLISKGIAENKIQSVAFGEQKPIADNDTENGKQSNRRVDILMDFSAALPPSLEMTTERIFPFDKDKKYSIQRLYKEFQIKTQEFTFKSGKETIIKGEKGTIIRIPHNAFNVPDASEVSIKLKEAYSNGDFISENLTTMSDDKMLQTGGMIHLEATYNGQPILPNENLMLMMPNKGRINMRSDDSENGMQFFTGQRNPKTQNMNWTLPEKPNFSFFFSMYNAGSQKAEYEKILKSATDTCNCNKMFVWQLDSFYVRQAIKAGQSTAFEPSIISDSKPLAYEFEKVHTEGLSKLCLTIASWAAPQHSWYRKVPWKLKHQIYEPAIYKQYRATDYDSLLRVIKRYIRLSEEAEAYAKTAKAGDNGFSVFETRNLNWINCDRFASYNAADIVTVETDIYAAPNVDAKIIFTKSNSVLNANSTKGIISFNRIPKEESATIVAMKIENGQSLYAIQNIRTSNTRIKFKFEPLTPEEIARKMKEL